MRPLALMALSIVLLISFPGQSMASDWTPTEKALYVAFLPLLITDLNQTSKFLAKGHKELNPVPRYIFDNYGNDSVPWVGVGAALGALIIAELLPSKLRTSWLAAIVVLEIGAILNNKNPKGYNYNVSYVHHFRW